MGRSSPKFAKGVRASSFPHVTGTLSPPQILWTFLTFIWTEILGMRMQHSRQGCTHIPRIGRGCTLCFNKFQVIIEGSSGKKLCDSAAMFAWILCLLLQREVVFWKEPNQVFQGIQCHSDRMSHGNNHMNPIAGKNDVQKVAIYGGKMCTSKGHSASHSRWDR